MLGFIGVFAIGLALGIIVTTIIFRVRTIGALRVDRSDPTEPPYLFLELSSHPNDIERKKYVTMRVDARNYLSQK